MADNVIGLNVVHHARTAWMTKCQKGTNGGLIPNLHNALLALRLDYDVRDVFAYDEMLCAPVMLHEIAQLATCHRPVEDTDVLALKFWFQEIGFPGMGTETVREAIRARAEENAFHPIRDMLRSLIWDGVKRLHTLLPRFFGTEFNPYTQHVGRMFMIQMIARVEDPGCQADYTLVLEGEQGALKSTACRTLVGPKYFSDSLPDLTGDPRIVSQHLRGKWLTEVPELHAFKGAAATRLKSFLTRREEIYIPRYGHNEVHEKRQGVFAGTTNEDTYWTDATGARRIWPVKTGVTTGINIDDLMENREQLFAEAYAAYRAGDQYWPDAAFESEMIRPEQAARQTEDPWEQRIRNYVETRNEVTTSEIAAECLVIIAGQQSYITDRRIADILKGWGWKRVHTAKGNVWRRPQ